MRNKAECGRDRGREGGVRELGHILTPVYLGKPFVLLHFLCTVVHSGRVQRVASIFVLEYDREPTEASTIQIVSDSEYL